MEKTVEYKESFLNFDTKSLCVWHEQYPIVHEEDIRMISVLHSTQSY